LEVTRRMRKESHESPKSRPEAPGALQWPGTLSGTTDRPTTKSRMLNSAARWLRRRFPDIRCPWIRADGRVAGGLARTASVRDIRVGPMEKIDRPPLRRSCLSRFLVPVKQGECVASRCDTFSCGRDTNHTFVNGKHAGRRGADARSSKRFSRPGPLDVVGYAT
jgi:hypothetical protein